MRPRRCWRRRRRLGGRGGLLGSLARYEAYGDPLAKKSFLFAKICARRGWLEVRDPESWEVCADNVLMRLALRSGLVHPGSLAEVRAGHPEGVQGRSPIRWRSHHPCSTTCCGSWVSTIQTCSAPRAATS